MKKSILLSVLLLNAALVAESDPMLIAPPNDVQEILAGGAQILSREMIAIGMPIHAYQVDRFFDDHPYVHRGDYVDARIWTYMEGTHGFLQTVNFYQRPEEGSRALEESRSSQWRTEFVGGARYVVHYHEGFRVYSRSDEQFVIVDREGANES